MKKVWVACDCDYLCWRAFYTTGDLDNGVCFGFLKEIQYISGVFDPSTLIFCFDKGSPLRRIDYPQYKTNRHTDPEIRKEVKHQIRLLRKVYLPELGFSNIFCQKGYEGDDCLAAVALQGNFDRLTLVSGDQDLYQLLNKRVSVHHPNHRHTVTEESFSQEYGVTPLQWIDVKSMAGCSSDNIDGIKGVGEKTACKFLNGTLKSSSVSFERIVKGNQLWKKNRHIVRLPYPGMDSFKVNENELLSYKKWDKLMKRIGMPSLVKEKKRSAFYE